MLSSSINLLFSSENIKKSLCFRLLFTSSLLRWFGKRHPMCYPNVRINLGQQFPAINHAMILRNAHPPPRQIPNKHWIATTRQSILDADPLRYGNGGKRHDGLYVFCAAPVLHQSHNRRFAFYVFSHRRISCSTVSRSQVLPAARGPSSTAEPDTACASPHRSSRSCSKSWRCRFPSGAPLPGLWIGAPPRRRTGSSSSVPPASLENRRVRQAHPAADVGGEGGVAV